jgi:predicted transcriptional regulator
MLPQYPYKIVLLYKSYKLRSKQDESARIKILTESKMIEPKSLTVACVLKSIADPISVELFQSISAEGSERSDLISKKNLSLRQYYSRISNLTRNGMLIKKKRKNYRTTFGKIVYHMLKTIENAITDYYKLKAIDSIRLYHDIPEEEHKKIIDKLIADQDIKDALLTRKSLLPLSDL